MGNQAGKENTTIITSNHPSNNHVVTLRKEDGFFHGLEMLVEATEFVLKRSCSSAMETPPTKRLRRSKRHRKVHFNETVHLRRIPHHTWYTDQERKAVWRSIREIRLHAKRNSVEMKWEGNNWRNAVEESHMFMDSQNRVRYHPCWVQVHYYPFQPQNKQHVSYNLVLQWFVHQHGITAFVDE